MLNLGNINITSVASDGYGQHLVGISNGAVKHYLYGNDGTLIYNTLSVSGGEYPVVTSYSGKVRVTMKIGNEIKIYQSINGGSTWPTIYTFPYQGVPIYNIDAYSDLNGTHIVWEDNAANDPYIGTEIYYVRYSDQASQFVNFKNVTDLPSPATGIETKVTASANQAHVVFRSSSFNRALGSRDLNISTGIWDASCAQLIGNSPIFGWRSTATIGDTIYAVGFCDVFITQFMFTRRHIDATEWQEAEVIGSSGSAGPSPDNGVIKRMVQQNGKLYVINQEYSPGITYRSYTPSTGWSAYEVVEAITGDQLDNSLRISVGQNGVYCFWAGSYPSFHQHMRRKPFIMTTAFNERTFLTGNSWLSGTALGIPSNITVDARSGSVTNIMANSIFNYQGVFNVNSGSTLKLYEGTTWNMGSAKSLTVNGSLIVQGTSVSPATIASANRNRGSWERINLYGGPNTIQYCTVKFGNYGIYINNSSTNTISNCTFDSCLNAGLYSISSNRVKGALTVNNSTFLRNASRGIGIINGRADLNNISLTLNVHGVMAYNALVYLDGSSVNANSYYGAYVLGSTSSLYFCADDLLKGYNSFMNNGNTELRVESSGWAWLGAYDPKYQTQFGGDNYIRNDATWSGALINNSGRACIPAQRNCWTTNSSTGILGCVDTSYSFNCETLQLLSEQSSAELDLSQMISELTKSVEDNLPDAENSLRHLASFVGPGGYYERTFSLTWEKFLQNIGTSMIATKEVKSLALAYYIHSYLNNQKYEDVLSQAKEILSANTDDDLWLSCQSARISALVNLGRANEAQLVLTTIKDRLIEINPEILSIMQSITGDGIKSQMKLGQVGEIPVSYLLFQNYPNPFNPTTVINYQLPADNYVTIKVYNILGEEIATLVDGMQDAGYKSVTFDGLNFSSGIYFVRMNAGPSSSSGQAFSDVKKIVLTK
jgi:parallel beta-helix repeat protein